jgi:hypothetical protein
MQVNYKTITGPLFQPRGKFALSIQWTPAPGRGYIIQHVARSTTTHNGLNALGVTSSSDYWEAWHATENGVFARLLTPQGIVNDYFSCGEKALNTWGHWEIVGDVYWMDEESFVSSEWIKSVATVGGAGCLYHRPSRPNPDSMSDLLHSRFHEGYWNALNGTNFYHVAAKPAIWPPTPAPRQPNANPASSGPIGGVKKG